jgi:WD40 repeat protein
LPALAQAPNYSKQVQPFFTRYWPPQGHTGWALSVAYSPDGKRVLTGSQDSTARIWDGEMVGLALPAKQAGR